MKPAGRLELTPEQAYDLVLAALDVVGSVSPAVLARCRREGARSSSPGIRTERLVGLADTLDALMPGVVARLHGSGSTS